ncbi:unnamed protein product [Pipistrellus nathusii]|uniref:Uncharacterized protein n=1 Tax=Pipistrellus nathusii TaxID=59473 RepID=A0ABP0AA19_PIPNA
MKMGFPGDILPPANQCLSGNPGGAWRLRAREAPTPQGCTERLAPDTFGDLRSSLLFQLKLKSLSSVCVCVSASHEMHPAMHASGSDTKQNCPSIIPLSPILGQLSLFAEFY